MAAEHFSDGQDEVGRRRALSQLAGHAHADDLRSDEGERLAEHRGFRFDAADAPAQDAEAVDHRCMGVGADKRVWVGDRLAVAPGGLDDLREELEVHLVDDAGAGRNDTEVAERLLGPPQEPVTFAVALIFVRHVDAEGIGPAEGVDLHRMVDDEVDGKERVDALRIAIPASYFGAKGSEIGNDGDAGEVLEEHARRQEGQFARGQRAGRPRRERADVVLCDDKAVEAAEEVLEEHADGERQAVDVGEAEFGEAVEAVVGDRAGGCFQGRESAEGVIRGRHGDFIPHSTPRGERPARVV